MKIAALTRRQQEIARLVARRLSNREIAQKLSLSEGTVKIHLHNAYRKLGIANRNTLAVMVSLGARRRAQKSREVHVASRRA
jgi:two-component system, NarL family, nitrate/nitrite response regulator NarL